MINVTVIGFGNVGSTLSLLLLNNKNALQLNIMETDKQCEGAFLDLAHSMSLYTQKELFVNDEALFTNADYIFLSAGKPNEQGESRLSKARENVQLSKDIFDHRKFAKSPYIVVITNPVDIVSHHLGQFSALPADRIIGLGTFIDSKRLAYYLSTISRYKAEDFEAFVLGEHGSSQVPIYSMTRLKDQPITDYPEFTIKELALAQKLTKNAASKIRETQQGTTYGVAKCAEVLFNYLLGEEEHLLTLSMQTNEHYRSLLQLDQNIHISMPVFVKNGKLEIYNDIRLTEEEHKAYQESASILARNS